MDNLENNSFEFNSINAINGTNLKFSKLIHKRGKPLVCGITPSDQQLKQMSSSESHKNSIHSKMSYKFGDNECDRKLEEVLVMTPIGDIIITVCGNGLHRLSRSDITVEPNLDIKVQIKDNEFRSKSKLIEGSVNWLADYFESGQQNGVPVPPICSSMSGSEFNRNVWTTLMIGTTFGKTISYSDLGAASVDKPNSGRAVGNAMKNNPFILMVPCHRVIKKGGVLGNYSAGNSLKQWLIDFEKQFYNK